MAAWTTADIPSLQGRLAVVTGTGGLGYEDALALARAGARVIIAGRDRAKGDQSTAGVRQSVPEADVRFEMLDLASLQSVRQFAARLRADCDALDILINNAGVMRPPARRVTADGFELQWGTNHLGHFLLTSELLPLLHRGENPRVVSVSSIAARRGVIDFDDLQAERHYEPTAAYCQSKLACLMFALELDRRSQSAGWGIQSLAAHPGLARTNLFDNGAGPMNPLRIARTALWFLFQPVAQGALPTLFAATARQAKGGDYYGPDTFGETRGATAEARIPSQAADANASARLWSVSETLTGATFQINPASPPTFA